MGFRFSEWMGCPVCNDGGDVSAMAYSTDFVLECYECGQISEYTFGEDVPFNGHSGIEIEATSQRNSSD